MKRCFAALLVLCTMISFAGCKNDTVQNTTASADTSQSTTSEATDTIQETPIEQLPMVSVSLPVVTWSEKAQDGTAIFNCTYQDISLILPEPEVADKVIVDFLNRTDITDDTTSICSQAKDAYAVSPAYWTPYLAQSIYKPMRIDSGILSMYGSNTSYTGAAHADTVYEAVSYDLVTGEVLSFADVLASDADGETLCQYVLDALKDASGLYEGYESIVRERFGSDLLQQTDWFFSGTGLCFFFSPYEIGPYASGDIVAEIPYGQLTGILNDAYFPAERQSTSGSVEAKVFDENALEQYSQFSEIILDEDGEQYLLYTDGAVYDLRLEIGSWSADGTTFTPECTVFAACSLTPGDAILVQAQLAEALPTLRLSYSTDDGVQYCYLTADGTTAAN